MEEICNRCVHKVICEMGAAPREVSVITGCYNFRAERPETNADRIRSMTDEELAEWFFRIQYDVSDYYCGGHSCEPTLPTGKENWLDWLKQEVNDNSTT